METILTYLLLLIFLYGLTHYIVVTMKKLGAMFTLVVFFKWFVGVCITFFAFYIIYISGNFLKEHDFSIVFSLPVGVLVWFVPMHFISKIFISLEAKYKKELP